MTFWKLVLHCEVSSSLCINSSERVREQGYFLASLECLIILENWFPWSLRCLLRMKQLDEHEGKISIMGKGVFEEDSPVHSQKPWFEKECACC